MLEKGDLFFRVKYPDKGQAYPVIDSLVYIGKNILVDDDASDGNLYFQMAFDFWCKGSPLDTKNDGGRVVCIDESELGDLFRLEELISELKRAEVNRKR